MLGDLCPLNPIHKTFIKLISRACMRELAYIIKNYFNFTAPDSARVHAMASSIIGDSAGMFIL